MKTIAIIPARYASSRFPGKPLADLGGKSMIQRVFERVSRAALVDETLVATDDDRIFDHVRAFGGQVRMTRSDHLSGTDRCAELAAILPEFDFVINVQGDEPFLDPAQVDEVARLLHTTQAGISTLARPITDAGDLFNPNVVKVVLDQRNRALYFSRSPIPHLRGVPEPEWVNRAPFYKHLGVYGFLRATLLDVTALPPSVYERAEALEQLRWLEAGYSIGVALTDKETLGIDTPADLERAQRLLEG